MTDQPPDHPTDHNLTTDRPPTDHAGGTDMLPIAEAALTLGITVNALRQRIKRGTLDAVKTDAGWLVATDHPTTARGRSTDHRPTTTDHRPTTTDHRPTTIEPAGLAPLAAMVADLARENRDLAAAAAVWQERARVLESRLLALSAGDTSGGPSTTSPDTPGATIRGNEALLSRWRRWLRW
jgi:hypothetical protein